MRNLKKCQLSELKKEMPTLDKKSLESIIGGHVYEINVHGVLIGSETDFEISAIRVNGNQFTLSGDINFGRPDSGGSGLIIEGESVNSNLFSFLCANTDVEWDFLFSSGGIGGCLITSNLDDKVIAPKSLFMKYDTYSHNHYDDYENYVGFTCSIYDWIEYLSLPSRLDITSLEQSGKSFSYIYNEITCTYHRFDKYSKTQEDYASEHNWKYVPDTK